ncbi:G:T/U mismatch-specific DNA glycosylase [Campylobacter subantarcticus LMG 24377]|uniref:G:T/U mismatch-specific DNA glycosylase n=2 Tax=Campylobacter subantarcticus TaxID=497724 RepID=A0A0A8HAU1_9BACT|nr:DNA-deoxyinosine glycosylase [Campylobacter subantarcticus]EAJ1260821.1 DNA-deoxyinosine glycosylase [Campylobacter lari]AJC89994.1 G:T/U mismatch-specific DNA glycosylase [Campylobacter subantarcticus LMG 24374]AJC91661.1 G:T/U mismatch-specific DNA glycosylase [Campylobacter subantarcticus LMG 24377]EAL3939057.1 DNA-deoxyinosine glycosylase [Campylobacter lari]MPB98893.1 DNA-deoxyinosine glycosylase [Campylobacter subantarcticus]
MQILTHPFEPFFDENAKILILGSFPSIKSRQENFYYQHNKNRFWRIFEILYDCELKTIADQKAFLKTHHIALWDVIASCKIKNSDDKTISYAKANDINIILKKAKIEKICVLGKIASKYFAKFYPDKDFLELPSSSPANMSYTLEKLVEQYRIIKER